MENIEMRIEFFREQIRLLSNCIQSLEYGLIRWSRGGIDITDEVIKGYRLRIKFLEKSIEIWTN